MSNTATESLSTEPVAVGVIETDAFCDGCGFNLHSQKVWRDDRLAIAICRCPECGKHAAAGARVTTNSVWLRRFALAGMMAWIAFQIAWVGTLIFGLILSQVVAQNALISARYERNDGQPVTMNYNSTLAAYEYKLASDFSVGVPTSDVVYRHRLAPWLRGQPMTADDDGRFATPGQAILVALLFGIPTLIASVILAALSWHWRRGLKWLWLLLPLLASAIVFAVLSATSTRSFPSVQNVADTDGRTLVSIMLVPQLLVVAIGLAIGMRVVRLGLLVFMPPKSRQLFAFLWHCDGLTMPVSSSAGEALRSPSTPGRSAPV